MTRALVIAAHGSQVNPNTALPAWSCVDAIRQLGVFDEVTAAFWKEQPAFGTVLQGLTADEVIIVPLFSSDGYFTRRVLLAELNPRPEQVVEITSAVGQNEFVELIVDRRVEAALAQTGWAGDETAVVVVGHGTTRSRTSGRTTEYQAQRLRDSDRFKAVLTGYLDQEPLIGDIYQQTSLPQLLVVPNFIAAGMHTQEDIPAALGIEPCTSQVQTANDRALIYTEPLGTMGELVEIVLRLAGVASNGRTAGSPWHGFPAMDEQILQQGTVGEVWLGDGGYLCHVDDCTRPVAELNWLETPAEIRAVVRFDASGEYRPWATIRTLPHGWAIPASSKRMRLAVLQTIYPRLRAVGDVRPLAQVVGRQQGKYRPVGELSAAQVDAVTRDVCASCILHPEWHHNGHGELTCPEACMAWLDAAVGEVRSEK